MDQSEINDKFDTVTNPKNNSSYYYTINTDEGKDEYGKVIIFKPEIYTIRQDKNPDFGKQGQYGESNPQYIERKFIGDKPYDYYNTLYKLKDENCAEKLKAFMDCKNVGGGRSRKAKRKRRRTIKKRRKTKSRK